MTYQSKKPHPATKPSPSVAPVVNRVRAKGYGLGRLKFPDLRDHLYLAKPRKAPATVRHRYWYAGKPLDQGQTPQCVGYSSHKWLTAGPVRNLRNVPGPTDCYHGAQLNDEWDGEDYEGSSVRGAFKWLQSQGYVDTYEWAFDVETVANWILTVGPMVAGTTWFSDMFDLLPSGFLKVSGDAVGGHAYALIGANRDKKCPDGTKGAIRMQNSWGDWGQGGFAWIAFTDFQKLLREDGECCCAREVRKPVASA